jgi:hypothetical protein
MMRIGQGVVLICAITILFGGIVKQPTTALEIERIIL